jgi:tetratricopeptide (TPR) repeat protein
VSHPFGNLVSQHLHRKHALSQSKLAAGILQAPAVVTAMCQGRRLTGPRARERVVSIIGWLHQQGALYTLGEANALLNAAGMASLNGNSTVEVALAQALRSEPNRAMAEASIASPTVTSDYALVGRQLELGHLRSAWNKARDGQAHFVCIAGEAGIGKTRLAEELMSEIQGQGHIVTRTRAYALEGRLAYAPVADWLRSLALATSVRGLNAMWRSELARLLPELLSEDATLTPPQPLTERWQRKNFFEALVHVFNALDGHPLLLVLDDLQWCDLETLEWLHYLMAAAPHLKLLIVGTVRDTELDAGHPLHKLWRDLTRDEQLTHVSLSPLSQQDTARLGAAVARHELTAHIAVQLFQQSEGNPLFAIESMRSQQEEPRESLTPASSRHASVAIPSKVYAVIQGRLAQLSLEARALAETAAVIGRAFTLLLLAQVSGRDEAAAAQGVDELWQRRLVREQDNASYDFSHDRIRDVAYAEITPGRRSLLHRAVAQALEQLHVSQLDAVSGELADHYQQAGLLEQALTYLRQSVAVSRRLYAHSETIRYLEKALAVTHLAADNPEFKSAEIDLWHELGFARLWNYGFGSAPVAEAWSKAHTLAMQAGSIFQRSRALLTLAAHFRNRGNWRQCRAYEELALPLAEATEDVFLIGSVLGSYGGSLYHFGELKQALMYLRRNVSLSDTPVQPSFLWMRGSLADVTHIRIAKCLWLMGFPDQARTISDEIVELAHTRVELFERFAVFDFTAMLHSFMRNVEVVRALGETLIDLGEKYGFEHYFRAGRMYRGWALAHCGDPWTGASLVRESINGHRADGSRQFEPYWRSVLAETLLLAGELKEANDEITAALSFADETGNTYWSAHLLKLKGDVAFALSGIEAEAEAWYCRALDLAKAQGAKSLALRASVSLARLWQRQGKCADAHVLLSRIYTWFTEGFDTADLMEAKALLEEMT